MVSFLTINLQGSCSYCPVSVFFPFFLPMIKLRPKELMIPHSSVVARMGVSLSSGPCVRQEQACPPAPEENK